MLFFSGCRVISKNHKYKVSLQESIARLSHIPDVPLGVQIKSINKSNKHPDSVQVFCDYGAMALNSLKNFYLEEMERLGWDLQSEYEGEELLLHFVKPSEVTCIVSIRAKQKLVITLLKKREMT